MNITPLVLCLIFIAFDVLTGWLKALATGTTNSSIMRKGLYHKLGEIIAVIFGYVCQYSLPYLGIEIDVPFAVAIGTYIVIMEIASIIENISAINPQMAGILKNVFRRDKLGSSVDGGETQNENES